MLPLKTIAELETDLVDGGVVMIHRGNANVTVVSRAGSQRRTARIKTWEAFVRQFCSRVQLIPVPDRVGDERDYGVVHSYTVQAAPVSDQVRSAR